MENHLINFDYAIIYLLRDKKDYTIVEGFISALLKTIGYSEVKILSQLASEGNQEDSKTKRALANLIVQDTNNQKYIVEIERIVHPCSIHKSYFNTSRHLIDSVGQDQDYSQILKIFHISLLFDIIPGTVSYGNPLIQEPDTKEKLTLHITDPTTKRVYVVTDVPAEYIYISVPSFDDRIEKELDEWLYVIKHNEVPKKRHPSYMNSVSERFSMSKMDETERNHYKLYTDRHQLQAAIEKGRQEKGIEIAKHMRAMGYQVEDIVKLTGLQPRAINNL